MNSRRFFKRARRARAAIRGLLPLCLLLAFSPSSGWCAGLETRFDPSIQRAVDKWWVDLPAWRLWKSQLQQESRLDPTVCSAVGACGLAQIMPRTFQGLALTLRFPETASPFDADYAIEAGAYYDAQLRHTWRSGRSPLEAHWLAVPSYNAGTGNILKAQTLCGEAHLWPAIQPCLVQVTGTANAKQTTDYVIHIQKYWQQMEIAQ